MAERHFVPKVDGKDPGLCSLCKIAHHFQERRCWTHRGRTVFRLWWQDDDGSVWSGWQAGDVPGGYLVELARLERSG